MSSTHLETQFDHYSTRPDYGTAQKGVQMFDLDGVRQIEPESVGLSAELDTVYDFMVSAGANPAHIRYTTIALYGPNSEYAAMPGTSLIRAGFVSNDMHFFGDCGLRFPVISLLHDKSNPDPGFLGFNLRHEIGHLVNDKDRIAPYNNEPLIRRLKVVAATTGALVTPSAVDMWDSTTRYNEMLSGVSPNQYAAAFMASSVGALAALALTYGLVASPYRVMQLFSTVEHRANRFSRRTRHFQPFSLAQVA